MPGKDKFSVDGSLGNKSSEYLLPLYSNVSGFFISVSASESLTAIVIESKWKIKKKNNSYNIEETKEIRIEKRFHINKI